MTTEVPKLEECPHCLGYSLFWHDDIKLWECLNPKCKRRVTLAELRSARQGKVTLGRNHKVGFPKPKKFLLLLLCVINIAVILYSAYLLFNHKVSSVTGIVILSVASIILIWNIVSVRRPSHRIAIGTIVWLLLFTAFIGSTASAYAGNEPFLSTKDKIATWVTTTSSNLKASNAPKANTSTPTTGLNLSSEYSKTYPAYEQDLGGGLKVYSKVVPFPPPIKVWNYKIQTTSRVYYAVKVVQTPEAVTMIGYWATEGDWWKFNNSEIVMNRKLYGDIQVSNVPAYEIR